MSSQPEQIKITVGDSESVSAMLYLAAKKNRAGVTVILGHGAGANQLHPFMRLFAVGLAERGFDVLTFNFQYMEQGRRVPDPRAKLEACYRVDASRLKSRLWSAAARRRFLTGQWVQVENQKIEKRYKTDQLETTLKLSATILLKLRLSALQVYSFSATHYIRPASRNNFATLTCRRSPRQCFSSRAPVTPSARSMNCAPRLRNTTCPQLSTSSKAVTIL